MTMNASWLAIAAIVVFPHPFEDPAKAIRGLLDQQVADWNKKDLDAFCNGYWKSPKLVFQSGGTKTEGWEGMRNRYRARYQGEGREMGTLVFSEVEIEPLGPESAFSRGRWELTMANQTKIGGRFTLILREFPEGWRIVHDHTSSDAKP
jgi:ketosteroid isomerase-like protein